MKVHPLSVSFCVSSESDILSSFERALVQVLEKQEVNFIPNQFVRDLKSAYTEGMVNAIKHAQELKNHGCVEGTLALRSQEVEIKIIDHGSGFVLDKIPLPEFKSFSDSGRGIFMMRQFMDFVDYKRNRKENALILKRTLIGMDKESKDLDLLYEISDAIIESSDIESVYRIILDKAVEVFGVEKASILIFDYQTKKLKVIASRGLSHQLSHKIQVRPGEGISGYVFQHAKPCLIEDMDRNQSGWEKKKKYRSRSFISAPMICSPMRIGQESIGVINMTDRMDGRSFTKRDLRLLTTIANQASAYLHICRLLSESKEADLMRKELQIAREIQQSYLPLSAPKVKGIKAYGWCETAQSVGGDYYDFISPDGDNFYAVVGDVSGHNVAAAITMANFRSQLKALLFKEKNPGRILTLLNQSLFSDLTRHDQFITMVLIRFYPLRSLASGTSLAGSKPRDLYHGHFLRRYPGVHTIDTRHRKIDVASAGHRSPLLIQGSKVSSLFCFKDSGSVLGVSKNETYKNLTYQLKTNNGLFLYTDGVIETMNSRGKRLGTDLLIKYLEQKCQLQPKELLDDLKKQIKKFRGNSSLTDDVTAVAIRIS